jgi:hypothetical protein
MEGMTRVMKGAAVPALTGGTLALFLLSPVPPVEQTAGDGRSRLTFVGTESASDAFVGRDVTPAEPTFLTNQLRLNLGDSLVPVVGIREADSIFTPISHYELASLDPSVVSVGADKRTLAGNHWGATSVLLRSGGSHSDTAAVFVRPLGRYAFSGRMAYRGRLPVPVEALVIQPDLGLTGTIWFTDTAEGLRATLRSAAQGECTGDTVLSAFVARRSLRFSCPYSGRRLEVPVNLGFEVVLTQSKPALNVRGSINVRYEERVRGACRTFDENGGCVTYEYTDRERTVRLGVGGQIPLQRR